MHQTDTPIRTVDELESILSKLMDLLQIERNNLVSIEENDLNEIVLSKNALLQKIAHIHPELSTQLRASTESISDTSAFGRVRILIERCKRFNRENGTLVAQNLKVCKNSMNLLRGDKPDTISELYNVQGQTDSTPTKRHHGVA